MNEEEMLSRLIDKIQKNGGAITVPVQDIAEELGVDRSKMYYFLSKWRNNERIASRNRGRKGMELALPGAFPTEPPYLPTSAARSGGPGAERRPDYQSSELGERIFCPWCGRIAFSGWNFCPHCGGRLPSSAELSAES